MDNIMSRLFEDILRKTVLLLWGAALLMAGCSESDPATEGLGAAPDGEVEFVFDLSAARAAIGEDGSGAFEDGDRIGLYVFGSPSQHFVLTRENGAWRPKLKKSDLGDGKISAYYPAREDVRPEENRHIHAVAADQSGEGLRRVGHALGAPGNRLVDGVESHRTAVCTWDAPSENPSDKCRRGTSRRSLGRGAQPQRSARSRFHGHPQDPGWTKSGLRRTPERRRGSSRRFFPQKLAPYTSGDGWLRIHAGGKTITFDAPNEIGGSKSFGSGQNYDARPAPDGRECGAGPEPDPGLEPDEEFRNKKLWLYGIDSPVYDPETVIEVSPGNPIDNYTPNVWVKYVYH